VRIIADADAKAKEYCTVYNRHRGKKRKLWEGTGNPEM
jgi:hypothetical protein